MWRRNRTGWRWNRKDTRRRRSTQIACDRCASTHPWPLFSLLLQSCGILSGSCIRVVNHSLRILHSLPAHVVLLPCVSRIPSEVSKYTPVKTLETAGVEGQDSDQSPSPSWSLKDGNPIYGASTRSVLLISTGREPVQTRSPQKFRKNKQISMEISRVFLGLETHLAVYCWLIWIYFLAQPSPSSPAGPGTSGIKTAG